MGIWDQGSFRNDGAMDWVSELERRGAVAITDALRLPEGYIPIDEAQHAIAAAEVIAAAHGEVAENLPDEVHAWVTKNAGTVGTQLNVASALATVARVRDASELQEVWAEGPRYELWATEIDALRKRLEIIQSIQSRQQLDSL